MLPVTARQQYNELQHLAEMHEPHAATGKGTAQQNTDSPGPLAVATTAT